MKHNFLCKDSLKAPVNVTWEITEKCNLKCLHCLSSEIMANNQGEIDFAGCCQIVDELERMEVFQINFGGGEPFLREDFLEILQYAQNKGITTCVSTNGTILNHELVKKLKEMELLYLQVSLDGATRETNDYIRGSGTYDLVVHGIKLLKEYHISNFSINTVVTRVNFNEISELYELASYYNAKLRLSRFRPAGNGKKTWDFFRLNRQQLFELSCFLGSHKDVLTGDSFFSIASEERRDLGLNMCGAAKMTCCIMPNGDIYPCAFLQNSHFLAGNIKVDSFSKIWQDSKVFKSLREINVESCKKCSRFSYCHGGCPAVAYFMYNSLGYHDPECLVKLDEEINNTISILP